MEKRYKVAVAIPDNGGHCRNIIRGVFEFAHQRLDWDIRLVPEIREPDRLVVDGWDGCIWLGRSLPKGVAEGKMPLVVDVSNASSTRCAFSVDTDDVAVGTMGAVFFLEQGYRHFGFAGLRNRMYAQRREEGFVRQIERAGHACSVRMVWEAGEGEDAEAALQAWLRGLPKPVAVMACSDAEALAVSRGAEAAGVRIPEDMALLGVDNDDLLCHLRRMPLSSIELDGQGIGTASASMLAARLEGTASSGERVLLPPVGIVLRSTCVGSLIGDPHVRAAQAFIREHAASGIRVPDVVRACGLNRRALEIRYRDVTGRTLNGGIMAVRMELARHLVGGTDMSIKQVAQRCGFRGAARFATVFRQETGRTPTSFRMACQRGVEVHS